MTKYTETVDREAQHTCIFGEPFTGKSTLAATVLDLGFKVLWISLDNGHVILRKLPREMQEKVDIVKIPDTRDFPVGIITTNKIMSHAPVSICDMHGQVDCSHCKTHKLQFTNVNLREVGLDTVVIIDHISQISDSAMAWVLKEAVRKGDKDATGEKITDPILFKPGRDQYALQGFLMNKFLTNLQSSPCHIIGIAHVIETELDDGRKRLVPYIGTGPFSRNAPKYFDHIIACEVYNKKHSFGSTTVYGTSITSGSRTDVDISKFIVDGKPTLKPFFEGLVPKIGSYGEEAASNVLLLKTAMDTLAEQSVGVLEDVSTGSAAPMEEVMEDSVTVSNILSTSSNSDLSISTVSKGKTMKEKLAILRGAG